jgi:hypothetical protein
MHSLFAREHGDFADGAGGVRRPTEALARRRRLARPRAPHGGSSRVRDAESGSARGRVRARGSAPAARAHSRLKRGGAPASGWSHRRLGLRGCVQRPHGRSRTRTSSSGEDSERAWASNGRTRGSARARNTALPCAPGPTRRHGCRQRLNAPFSGCAEALDACGCGALLTSTAADTDEDGAWRARNAYITARL